MSLFNMINSFLNPEDAYADAYDEAKDQAYGAFNTGLGYQQPYWQNGLNQYDQLMGAQNSLLNPSALENEWSKNYETSPYAKQLLQQNQSNGLDAASSMGLNGSSAAVNNIQQGAGNIVSKDRQQYLNDLMQKFMSGFGIGQNIYGIGAQTAGNIGTQAGDMGKNLSQLGAQLKFGEGAAPGNLFGNILGSGLAMYGAA